MLIIHKNNNNIIIMGGKSLPNFSVYSQILINFSSSYSIKEGSYGSGLYVELRERHHLTSHIVCGLNFC